MKKFLVLSVTLSMLLTACSVDSDSEKNAQNKEQYIIQNTVSELAVASLNLEQIYYTVGGTNTSVSEVIDLAQNLATSPEFINEHALQTSGYIPVSTVDVEGILALDQSAIQQSSYSEVFKNHVVNIINGQNIQSYRELVNSDHRLHISEKRVLLDAIDFGSISSDHGVDDEWRKRKIMGYVMAQELSSLNVVITATVLNIAMKQ